MSLNDGSYERQPGRTAGKDSRSVCTFARKVTVCISATTFGLGSLSVALEVHRARAISCVENFHADARRLSFAIL